MDCEQCVAAVIAAVPQGMVRPRGVFGGHGSVLRPVLVGRWFAGSWFAGSVQVVVLGFLFGVDPLWGDPGGAAVDAGGAPALFLAFVVVVAAGEDAVVDAGGAALGVVDGVVDLAPGGRYRAGGEGAAAVDGV